MRDKVLEELKAMYPKYLSIPEIFNIMYDKYSREEVPSATSIKNWLYRWLDYRWVERVNTNESGYKYRLTEERVNLIPF
jgi:hypothetical protein